MNRDITESPERWVIVKITNESGTHYRVFGSWAGGYLDGDRWKMNSGIASVEEDDTKYYFNGHSGSCYQCHKSGYGIMTSYSQGILANMIKETTFSIEILPEETDFMGLLSQNKDG